MLKNQLQAGDVCGPFRIVEEIARGGMGVVYMATSPEGEKRAIKTLQPKARIHGDIADRFRREVQLLSYIDHVHVVRFYDAGVLEQSGEATLWVALEYLAGRTLRELIVESGGKLPVDRVIRWGRQIAQGVHEAHKLRVIHRDLKPENVAIVPGDIAKVFDFGIAKYRDWGVRPTVAGTSFGTVVYMAPEQLDGSGHIDASCDVYALGLILFELFSGRHPIADLSKPIEIQQIIMRTLTQAPPKLSERMADFPPLLSNIVDKALEKKPADRFSSMLELSDALSEVHQQRLNDKRAAFLSPSPPPAMAAGDQVTTPLELPSVSSETDQANSGVPPAADQANSGALQLETVPLAPEAVGAMYSASLQLPRASAEAADVSLAAPSAASPGPRTPEAGAAFARSPGGPLAEHHSARFESVRTLREVEQAGGMLQASQRPQGHRLGTVLILALVGMAVGYGAFSLASPMLFPEAATPEAAEEQVRTHVPKNHRDAQLGDKQIASSAAPMPQLSANARASASASASARTEMSGGASPPKAPARLRPSKPAPNRTRYKQQKGPLFDDVNESF